MRSLSYAAFAFVLLTAPFARATIYCDSCGDGTANSCCDPGCPCKGDLVCNSKARCVEPWKLDAGGPPPVVDTGAPDTTPAATDASTPAVDGGGADDASAPTTPTTPAADAAGCSCTTTSSRRSDGACIAALGLAAAIVMRRRRTTE